MRERPFLYLLENIDKVDIDERIIPVFKEVLIATEKYFEENNLLDVADFASIIDRFYLSDSSEKIKIIFSEDENAQSSYVNSAIVKNAEDGKKIINNEEMRIIINGKYDLDVHKVCHEFIHSLVWKNMESSPEKNDLKYYEVFFDEGATESLARKISGYVPNILNNVYNENTEYSRFIETLYGEKDFYKYFFSGKPLSKITIGNEKKYMDYSIILVGFRNNEWIKNFYEDNKNLNPQNIDNLFRNLEGELIVKALDNYENSISNFDTINDLINFVKKASTRPLKCRDELYKIYIKAINKYLSKFSFSDMDSRFISSKIYNVIENFDELYLYGPDNYALLTMFSEQNNIYYENYVKFCIDKDLKPIKNDLEISCGGIGYFAYADSNDENRVRYRKEKVDKNSIDFSEEPNRKKDDIKISFNKLFNYSEDFTKTIINELLVKYCEIDISSLTNDNLNSVMMKLKENIDPLLFESINGIIPSLIKPLYIK